MDLPVPEFFIAEIRTELVSHGEREDLRDLGVGPVFASRSIKDPQEFSVHHVEMVGRDLGALILLFDWWVYNEDRTLSELGGNPNLLWSNGDNHLSVFDLNLAFDREFSPARFWERHLFRSFAAGWDAEFQAQAIRGIDQGIATLPAIWDELPEEWLTPGGSETPDGLSFGEVVKTVSRVQVDPEAFWKARL